METTLLRDILWYARIALQGVLLLRLLRLGLFKTYPVLVTLLSFQVVRSVTLAALGSGTAKIFGLNAYNLLFVVTEPLRWLLYFLLILELYSLMLEQFPGVRRLGRLVMFSGLVAVALVCGAVVFLDEQAGVDPYPFLGFLVLQERSVFLALSILMLLLLLFVAHYRLTIRRNVWVLCVSFGGYHIATAALLILRRYIGAEFDQIWNFVNVLLFFTAMLGAVFFFSAAGENETRPMSIPWGRRDRELEAALSLQLQSFNQALVKVLRQ